MDKMEGTTLENEVEIRDFNTKLENIMYDSQIARFCYETLDKYERRRFGHKEGNPYQNIKRFLKYYYLELPKLEPAEAVQRINEFNALPKNHFNVDDVFHLINLDNFIETSRHQYNSDMCVEMFKEHLKWEDKYDQLFKEKFGNFVLGPPVVC